MQAAKLFAQDVPVPEIAKRLRVSHNAVHVWRRRWLSGGEAGWCPRGPRGPNVGFRPSSRTGWPPRCEKAPLHTATPKISANSPLEQDQRQALRFRHPHRHARRVEDRL
ncbi:helix-turn-helix domain-containing protein [Saccharopolyspora erythraea]|nr:helix-turn-helix domain-containing protein [Saccharopolyspora erythraea]